MEFLSYALLFLYLLIIISLIARKKSLGKNIIMVIAAMALTFISEAISSLLLYLTPRTNTTPLFVFILLGPVYATFIYYFYSLTEGKLLKKFQLGVLGAHVLNYGISAVMLENFFTVFPQITNFISIILMIVSIMVFFRDIFDSDRIMVIRNYYPFWLGVSLIIIYLGILPIMIFGARIDSPINIKVFKTVLLSVNLLGYITMLITIFLAKNIEKKKAKFIKWKTSISTF